MKPDVLLVPVLWPLRARAALYFGSYAGEASAGKIISEGHCSLFRVPSSLTTAHS
ncbi:hypothetical protein NXW90_22545 [Bacteroides fragilis]|nr:hypothetical protein [Bacteroides fragilis]